MLGLDAKGQQAWITLLLSIVTVADWPVSWLGPVSASVPTQYPQTNTLLAASPDSGTTVPGGAVSGLCRVRGCDSSVDRNGAPGQVVLKLQGDTSP